ncbi:MAG TPA: VWA domain-containing protein [Thermoleophilia bacterium]|nr:VWA domain-containing protein [Thermoleophilia bacterium]
MFTRFFFLLRAYGVPVTVTEWMMLMRALSEGLALSSLDRFYSLARSILVKSESFYDQYDQAFAACFEGVETPIEIADEVWDWLADPLALPNLSDEEKRQLVEMLGDLDLDELQRLFAERVAEQTEAHHGGNKWVGTGGTSPFGHSGVHPGGIRVGGESRSRSAVKVAGERRYRGYRTDVRVGVRQFELALRRLRQLSSRNEGPADELDLEATVDETAEQAGRLSLVWQKSRKNAVKVLLAMDVGGSMHPYLRLCSQLFSAVNSQTHFKDLRTFYFHNCIYDWLYTDTDMTRQGAVSTNRVLHDLSPDYKLIIVGDAAMAPSELLSRNGIIWWGYANDEPGIEWLRRLRHHFDHSVWLNTIPREQWEWAYGARTIGMIRQVLPMEELSLDGLQAAVKRLMVAR